ncbi:alpha/beta fold hydrolase [Elioraea sp.]|uniref:alpha/beta fold hydrolase n=1 Tax=Elioraea sp. TaxID=2185103 RepID=UPI0021DBA43F|nr:alpha/beta hydrolase [Elioraea sp.]GIX10120.1 MAG: fluoroacetate dehalogenase [Elioraea sp.]
MFPGFTLRSIEVGPGIALRVRTGGSGPPLLLLHGNPQTHAMWHKVAPALAARFSVVCPDLRGYGFSSKPPPSPDHAAYAKRAMAADMVALMQQLGFDRFRLVGHDRGARVGHRLMLDHPDRVERAALLDIIPTLEHFERAGVDFAMGYHHWFFLAQPAPYPETLIAADPRFWLLSHSGRHGVPPDFFAPEAFEDYLAALRAPGTIAAICEDYRAAAGIDLEHDRTSRAAGQRITCPLLVLWGAQGRVGAWYDVPEIWRLYATDLRGAAIPSGHYLAEEAPAETLAALLAFL